MFTVANILTGCNLLSGIMSIIFAFSGRIELAVIAILCGAIFDFLDGFMARLLKQHSPLGKQLDSLADMVTFGVAPGVIVFILLIISGAWSIITDNGYGLSRLWHDGTFGYNIHYWIATYFNNFMGNNSPYLNNSFFHGWYLWLPLFAFLIPFMSLFRLAKFNIDTNQTKNFIGLPTPANSIFFVSLALVLWKGFGESNQVTYWSLLIIQPEILLPCILVFSLLLVSNIPMFSLKFSNFSWNDNQIRFIFLLVALIIIIGLRIWAIPLIIIIYILFSIISHKFIKPKTTKS